MGRLRLGSLSMHSSVYSTLSLHTSAYAINFEMITILAPNIQSLQNVKN